MECTGALSLICTGVGAVENVVNAGRTAVAIGSDPLGWFVQQMQDGVHGLAALVIPYVLGALEPDYSAEWWRTSYSVSFGVAVLVLGFLMIVTAARRVRGEIGPKAVLESYFFAVPAFIIGATFGPLIGIVISRIFVGAASSLAVFFFDTTAGDFWKAFADRVTNPDAEKLAGSALLAALVYLVLIAALLGVVFILVIQLATQYMVGALIPLGLVWMTHPDTRRIAKVGPLIWISILASHVLLVLVLGFAFMAMNAMFLEAGDTNGQDHPMKLFVNIAVPTVLMALVVFAPMRLLGMARFASPSNGGGQASSGGFSTPAQAPQPGQTALNAQQVADRNSRTMTASPSPSSSESSVSSSVSKTSNTTGAAGEQAAKAGSAAKSGAGLGAGASTGAGAGATAGTGALGTAGRGAMATGVGAPVGVSAVMIDAALAVAHKASRAAEQAAEQAADAGDERD